MVLYIVYKKLFQFFEISANQLVSQDEQCDSWLFTAVSANHKWRINLSYFRRRNLPIRITILHLSSSIVNLLLTISDKSSKVFLRTLQNILPFLVIYTDAIESLDLPHAAPSIPKNGLVRLTNIAVQMNSEHLLILNNFFIVNVGLDISDKFMCANYNVCLGLYLFEL